MLVTCWRLWMKRRYAGAPLGASTVELVVSHRGVVSIAPKQLWATKKVLADQAGLGSEPGTWHSQPMNEVLAFLGVGF